MYGRIVSLSNAALKGELPEEAKELSIPDAMDEMIRWFCILFGNQFTPDDVLDYYPVDRLMHDIALALMAVQTQTTSILDEFLRRRRRRRRRRSSRRHRPPDAAEFHLLDVQQPAGERLADGRDRPDGYARLLLRVRAWHARRGAGQKETSPAVYRRGVAGGQAVRPYSDRNNALRLFLPLVQDADDEHFRLHAKIEDAVMLAKQVSILCVYWDQRIQGLAASGKMFQR